jgi:multiple sugar transport system substrate-binding protein
MGRRTISRRHFIQITGGGIAGAALLGIAGCGGGGGEGGSGEFTFSFGPDPSGSLQALVDRFNQQFEGEYTATWREMPADTGAYFNQLQTEFQAGESNIDLIGGDVIWPAQLAAPGYLADLSDRFPESERSKFLSGPIESNTYDGTIFGVPWFTDAGVLYYRSDLLEEAGMDPEAPPETWDELKQMGTEVAQATGTRDGFVFQGSNYEGTVVNGVEYIGSFGGSILDPNDSSKVLIDSPEAIDGLATMQSMVADGVAPQAVANYTETESQEAFLQGNAVFFRCWPYIYGLLDDPEASKITTDQVGVARLPAGEGGESVAGLGGWNFLLNAASENQDAAYEFVRFAASPEQQKMRALEGGFLPTLQSLYEDQEVLDAVPVVEQAGTGLLESTIPRPISPYYSDMSLRLAEQFNNVVKGDTSPEEAASTLQDQLNQIIEQGA